MTAMAQERAVIANTLASDPSLCAEEVEETNIGTFQLRIKLNTSEIN